ncbi:MAG: DUF3108 domain-containing protein [Candidatus Accumulibacter sp.]|jgi:hypothetical protein|nr:DUF3108 domain-containing protein [Accumulibacter sp.]
MPLPLIAALAVSLGVHACFLFAPSFGLKDEARKLPLRAELRLAKSASGGAGSGTGSGTGGATVGTASAGSVRAASAAPDEVQTVKAPVRKPGKETPKKRENRENEPVKTPTKRTRQPVAKKPTETVKEREEKTAPKEAAETPQTPAPTGVASGAGGEDFGDGSGEDSGDGSASGGTGGTIPYGVEEVDFPDGDTGGSRNAGGILGDASAPPRLPPGGRIDYRVDFGDREFEAGKAVSEWTIADGRYHLKMEVETVGLAWLVKPYRAVMESRGRVMPEGLVPDLFSVSRNGEDADERAVFDWRSMTVSVGKSGRTQAMEVGAQDLLSFNFHLGFMRYPVIGSRLPLVTGKKYGVYLLEKLGDEEIETPVGTLRTLHLGASGARTELWLAYDYLLLPVKIRFVDSKGQSFVQIVSALRLNDTEVTGTARASNTPSAPGAAESQETFGSSEGG